MTEITSATGMMQYYSSLPEGMSEKDVGHIEAVKYKSFDGTSVPAVLITEKSLDRNKRHPALVYMYGHWLQLALLGWTDRFSLFDYLVQKGYAVLCVDPRGSHGYGNEYTKAYYREAAGKQVEDMIGAAKFLGGLNFIDPKGIGIFGSSYGGYLAVETVLQAPDAYAACIATAGVFDLPRYWNPYNTYTKIRFGSPDERPYPLFEKNPVTNVDKLKAALYLFHGTSDFNVPISQSEALVRALLKAGKEFEYMAYPGEVHSWESPEVIRDYILRIEKFLDKYLKHPPSMEGSKE